MTTLKLSAAALTLSLLATAGAAAQGSQEKPRKDQRQRPPAQPWQSDSESDTGGRGRERLTQFTTVQRDSRTDFRSSMLAQKPSDSVATGISLSSTSSQRPLSSQASQRCMCLWISSPDSRCR